MAKCDFHNAAFLKSHFAMGVLLYICRIFSEHLFLKTPLGDCLSWSVLRDMELVQYEKKLQMSRPTHSIQMYLLRKIKFDKFLHNELSMRY